MKSHLFLIILFPTFSIGSAFERAVAEITVPQSTAPHKNNPACKNRCKKMIRAYTATRILMSWYGIRWPYQADNYTRIPLPRFISGCIKNGTLSIDILFFCIQAYLMEKIVDGTSILYDSVK